MVNYRAIAYNGFQGLTNVCYFSKGVIIDNVRNLTLIHVQHSTSTTGKTGRRYPLYFVMTGAVAKTGLVCSRPVRGDASHFHWYLSFEISNNRRKNINSACLLVRHSG